MADVTITLSIDDAKLAADLAEIAGASTAPVPVESVVRLAGLRAAIHAEQTLEDGASAPLYIPDLVDLGGLVLRRPSLGALMIVERAAAWNVTDRWTAVHTACVLHHADDPDALARLARLETADDMVADFAPRCRFDETAWRRALVVLMSGLDPDDPDQKKTTLATTPHGVCACIPGVSRAISRNTPAEPLDIGSGMFRRARRWLRGATSNAAGRRKPPTAATNGRTATPLRFGDMSTSTDT